jgi:hypothetical protein
MYEKGFAVSKKKPREATVSQNQDSPVSQEPEATPPVTEANNPLLAEVQSFLSKREELARKLAEEIAATEAKLAELRKTAASLFPESTPAVSPVGKDKKPVKKLPKAKPLVSAASTELASEATAPTEPAPPANAPASPSSDNADNTPID